MDVNEETKSCGKRGKWNRFQRGFLGKAQLTGDPVELQRVSFATSIDDLPARPNAFQQVLTQIKSNKKNSPNSGFRMAKLQNLKKLGKDIRGSSPQNNQLTSSTSSPTPRFADSLLQTQHRPRSSSNTSATSGLPEVSFTTDLKEPDLPTNTFHEYSLSSEPSLKTSDSVAVPASVAAGAVLGDFIPTPATVASDMGVPGSSDTVDGMFNDAQRNRQIAEQLKQKILKLSESLKAEQAAQDENVAEYLRLHENADKQQASRIRNVFEKKNQKSNANILQWQKKLDSYHRKLRELDNGSGKQGLFRDVGANLRDFSGGVVDSFKSVTSNAAGAIVNKPKEMATKIKSRFGSTDNLIAMKEEYDGDDIMGSADDVSSASESVDNNFSLGSEHDNHSRHSMEHSGRSRQDNRIDNSPLLPFVFQQLQNIKNEIQIVREIQDKFQQECNAKKDQLELQFNRQLEEERLRHEDHLNDLNELHHREIAFMKQELTSMEEKMEYHAHERARDVEETLESCQTRISKMELQQQQQSVSVEGLENATARALVGKLINLLLSVMAVLLVLVSTISGIIMPFIKSQGRVFVTVLVTAISIISYRNWNTLSNYYNKVTGS